jgi:hypothetical protein
MKFLISNYSSPWNTEPFYFNAAFSLIGVQSKIFNPQSSIYDECDAFLPDVIITHVSHISKDMLHYIVNNKKITLMINTDNIKLEDLNQLSSSLEKTGITAIFFGKEDIQLTNGKYVKILQSADIFLNNGRGDYKINKLIFVNSQDDISEIDGSYHYTSSLPELSNYVDFIFPINILTTLFSNYDEIVFKDPSYIGSQTAFNAIYSGTKVIFDTKESNDLEQINSIFKGGKLLSSVKNKHTCLHRVKSLLSQLNCKDIIEKLESEISKL